MKKQEPHTPRYSSNVTWSHHLARGSRKTNECQWGKQLGGLLKSEIQPYPAILPPKYLLKRNENICPHKDLYMNVHSSIIRKRPKVDTAQMSINVWMDKTMDKHMNVPHPGTLFSNEQEPTTDRSPATWYGRISKTWCWAKEARCMVVRVHEHQENPVL